MKDGETLTDQQVMVPDSNKSTYDSSPLPEMEKLLATVKSVKIKIYKKPDAETNEIKVTERAKFCFSLADYEGRLVWGSVPYHTQPGPKTKLYDWARLVLSTEKPSSYNDLVGKKVYVLLENAKVSDKNGNLYQNVVKLISVASKDEVKVDTPVEEELNDTVTDVDANVETNIDVGNTQDGQDEYPF